MFRKKKFKQQPGKSYETIENTISDVFEKAKKSSDFTTVPLLENQSLINELL